MQMLLGPSVARACTVDLCLAYNLKSVRQSACLSCARSWVPSLVSHTHAQAHTHTPSFTYITHMCVRVCAHTHTHNLRVSHVSPRVSPIDPLGWEGAAIFLCGVLHPFPPFPWTPPPPPVESCTLQLTARRELEAAALRWQFLGPRWRQGSPAMAPLPPSFFQS